MKCPGISLSFMIVLGALLSGGAWAQSTPAQKPRPLTQAEELAQQAVAAAQKDDLEGAIQLFRHAYRFDHNPRWLYNLAVLHDRLAECDEAAFFYRAALWGKGVLPQDKEAVDNRLAVLEEECHFKARHATQADRHNRAARYMAQNMCALAEAILTGIITPAERKQLEECKVREKALMEKK
ncbi:MAG: hypothetical protein RMK29_02585 [Myxococcales bacterium]|nr:hypothetical protein [Myxococcota bacterium]MDW8280568.1 hypothetical protein [Myxococcales bacterium]